MQRADPLAFRQAASRFATGVAVLTALDSRGEVCGMTANSFVTISLSPPTVLVSVKPGKTHDAMSASGRYGVNVLPEQAKALSRHFAGQPRRAVPDYEIVEGLPRLSNCVAFFACEVTRTIDVSDHTAVHRRSIGVRLLRQSPAGVLFQPVSSGPGETGRPHEQRRRLQGVSDGHHIVDRARNGGQLRFAHPTRLGIARVKRRKPGEPVSASNAGSRFSSAKAKPALA